LIHKEEAAGGGPSAGATYIASLMLFLAFTGFADRVSKPIGLSLVFGELGDVVIL
jgi:hypothetical protein